MEKVALVLFVKDEADEIAWWIAWHLTIGINTILIYDDGSSDGTWEIVNAAAKVLDVRCFRTAEGLRFQHRQGQTYMRALDDFRSEFDWIGFLDADEYLDLKLSPNIQEFLGSFVDADGVAINWCCYGSNNHIIKPNSNPLEAYTRHSDVGYSENNYVKSFVRPKHTDSIYLNTHQYAVHGRYVLPDGSDVVWEEPHLQRSVSKPNWDKALIRHYIIRSVEHYVEKVKRRSDIRTTGLTMDFFRHYDRNDVAENIDKQKVERLYSVVYAIQHEISLHALSMMTSRSPLTSNGPVLARTTEKCYAAFTLRTIWGSTLAIDLRTGLLCHALLDLVKDATLIPVVGFTLIDNPQYIYLTSALQRVPMHGHGDNRISTIIAYKLVDVEGKKIALQCPNSKKFVSFVSSDLGEERLSGAVEANREWASSWEELSLQEFPDEFTRYSNLDTISALFSGNNLNDALKVEVGLSIDILADMLLAKISTLSQRDITKWLMDYSIHEIPWLNVNNRVSH